LGKSPAENVVRIVDPNGDVVLTHVKYGGNDFESTLKGDSVLQTVDTPYLETCLSDLCTPTHRLFLLRRDDESERRLRETF
jgi:hypothetical protein